MPGNNYPAQSYPAQGSQGNSLTNITIGGIASTLTIGVVAISLAISAPSIAPTTQVGTPSTVQVAPSTGGGGIGTAYPGWTYPAQAYPLGLFGFLAPQGIEPTTAIGTPSLTVEIHPSSIAPTTQIGAVIVYGLNIYAESIVSTTGVGAPSLTVYIFPVAIESTLAFGTHSVGEVHVYPSAIASTLIVGTPEIGRQEITPPSIVSTLAFGTLAIGEQYLTITAGISSTLAFGTTSLVAPTLDLETVPVGALRLTLLNSAGTIIAQPLMTVTGASVKRVLDQIGSMSFSVPATDPLVANITQGIHVRAYHNTLGYLGEYIVRGRRVATSQQSLDVECWSLLRELTTYNCYLRRQYDVVAVSTILSTANISGNLYGLLYGTGWTPGTIDAGMGNVYFGLEGQSIFEGIDALRTRLKKHFREGTTARTLDFGAFGTDTGYRLIAPPLMTSDLTGNTTAGIIEELSQDSDPEEVTNKIVPLGGGQGLAQLTLEECSLSSPYTVQTGTNPDGSAYYYLRDAASVTTYGERTRVLPLQGISPLSNTDADVTNAANALYTEAVSWLQWNKDEHIVFGVKALQVPAGLLVGDKVRVVYRGVVTRRGAQFKWIDVDTLFYVMERTDDIDQNGAVHTSLTLSSLGRMQQNDTEILIGTLQQIKIAQTFVQPFLGRESYVYREEIAPSHTVTCPIDIDSGVLYLNHCTVRVQTRPLRSTVTAAAAGGGTTVSSASGGGQTTSSGGSQAPTSSSGGSQTPTSSSGGAQTSSSGGSVNQSSGSSEVSTSHSHTVTLISGVGNNWVSHGGTSLYVSGGGFFITSYTEVNHTHNVTIAAHTHTVADHTHTVTVAAHTHTVTVAAHTHTVSNHTHSVTLTNHTHTMTYGIYDDAAYPTSISLAINGTDRTSALGGPWMVGGGAMNTELDITSYLTAGTLRQLHSLVFSCAGGQGQIIATIRILETTQAIAVV